MNFPLELLLLHPIHFEKLYFHFHLFQNSSDFLFDFFESLVVLDLFLVCLGMCCENLAGRPEHLDRAPCTPYGVGGSINNGSHWQSLESSHGSQPSLYSLSLLFVVENVVLYRRDLSVGSICWVYSAHGSWGSSLLSRRGLWQGGQECGDIPLFLLAPFV